jgi:hypothetical protein
MIGRLGNAEFQSQVPRSDVWTGGAGFCQRLAVRRTPAPPATCRTSPRRPRHLGETARITAWHFIQERRHHCRRWLAARGCRPRMPRAAPVLARQANHARVGALPAHLPNYLPDCAAARCAERRRGGWRLIEPFADRWALIRGGASGHLGLFMSTLSDGHRTAAPSRKRYLNPRARRALELLASNALGLTEAFMLAHGFTRTMVAALVRAGFVATQREAIGAGGKLIKIARIEITASGRRALEADRRNPPSWPAIGNFPPL